MADFWQWKGSSAVDGAGLVDMATSLDKDIDSIDVAKMSKGSVLTVITATITATLTADTTYTSAETSIAGYNSILMETTQSTGGRTIVSTVAGTLISGNTMIAIIDKDTSAQMTCTATANKTVKFIGLPDHLGLSMTLSAGFTAGTSVTLRILSLNL